MPQDLNYWNPYRFVPVRDTVKRRKPATGERIVKESLSGRIECTLTNLTPLFIGTKAPGAVRPFLPSKVDQKPLIPGSSLKGLFRALAETIGGGCSVTYFGRDKNRYPVPPFLEPCSDNMSLCVACRLFGMMGRGANAKVMLGNVSVGDAHHVGGEGKTKPMEICLGNPKVTHAAFYQSENGKVDGRLRKFYFHQPIQRERLATPAATIPATQRKTIQALPPDNVFRFEVSFSKLAKDELALLLYVIALEDNVVVNADGDVRLQGPMRHKLGHAKPLGGGSCHINMETLVLYPPPKSRFRTLTDAEGTRFEGDGIAAEVAKRTADYRNDKSPTMEKLRIMMVWDENDPRVFRYPDFNWFKAGGNSQVTLKQI